MKILINIPLLENNPNVTMITTNETGIVETTSVPYKDFVKANTKTNILSFEVSPGVYSYTVQPKIRLDFSEILNTEVQDTSVVSEEVKPEVIVDDIKDKVSIEDKKKDIENRRKDDLFILNNKKS